MAISMRYCTVWFSFTVTLVVVVPYLFFVFLFETKSEAEGLVYLYAFIHCYRSKCEQRTQAMIMLKSDSRINRKVFDVSRELVEPVDYSI